MPDILIRGMEIWEHCADCPMLGWGEVSHCLVNERDVSLYAIEGKPPDCPALELPPHGDLIDRNAVIEDLRKDDTYQNWDFRQMLGKQPVIVPAERRESSE